MRKLLLTDDQWEELSRLLDYAAENMPDPDNTNVSEGTWEAWNRNNEYSYAVMHEAWEEALIFSGATPQEAEDKAVAFAKAEHEEWSDEPWETGPDGEAGAIDRGEWSFFATSDHA